MGKDRHWLFGGAPPAGVGWMRITELKIDETSEIPCVEDSFASSELPYASCSRLPTTGYTSKDYSVGIFELGPEHNTTGIYGYYCATGQDGDGPVSDEDRLPPNVALNRLRQLLYGRLLARFQGTDAFVLNGVTYQLSKRDKSTGPRLLDLDDPEELQANVLKLPLYTNEHRVVFLDHRERLKTLTQGNAPGEIIDESPNDKDFDGQDEPFGDFEVEEVSAIEGGT